MSLDDDVGSTNTQKKAKLEQNYSTRPPVVM